MCKILYSLILILFFNCNTYAQDLDLSSYLQNVVDIGNDNFGLIVGEIDSSTISFITTGNRDTHFFSGISVKFYNNDYESTAYLIENFIIGNYSIALYKCTKPKNLNWRNNHYDFFYSDMNTYKTFLNNGKSDNQWSNYREPIYLTNLTNGIATLRMESIPIYSRGMPMLNNNGSLVGIIASVSNEANNLVFEAIDFSIIENILIKFSNCKHFNIIRYGQKLTPCKIEDKEKKMTANAENKLKRQNRNFLFTAAPSFNLGVYTIQDKVAENSLGGFGYTAGINFYYRPDEVGKTRIVFKPRISNYNVSPNTGKIIEIGNSELQQIDLNFTELPLLLEYVINYGKNTNHVIAFGYATGFHNSSELYHLNPNGYTYMKNIHPKSDMFHKLLFEITFENRISRWGFFYATQLNKWFETDYKLKLGNDTFFPFENHKQVSHYFGAEFSWRLWGNWLIKEK